MGDLTITSSVGNIDFTTTFRKRQDRFDHSISIATRDALIELRAAATEQPSAWPPNPPIQNVTVNGALLGTGMAGNSFWSLAVSPLPHGGLLFDVACRVKESPQWLGSTYRSPCRLDLLGDDVLQVATAGLIVHVRLVDDPRYAPRG